jgi:hypothetical protein
MSDIFFEIDIERFLWEHTIIHKRILLIPYHERTNNQQIVLEINPSYILLFWPRNRRRRPLYEYEAFEIFTDNIFSGIDRHEYINKFEVIHSRCLRIPCQERMESEKKFLKKTSHRYIQALENCHIFLHEERQEAERVARVEEERIAREEERIAREAERVSRVEEERIAREEAYLASIAWQLDELGYML